MKIKWLRTALKNVQEIGEYISMDNPIAAKSALNKIETSVNLLSENPAMGKAGRISDTREIIVGNCIIPYRVKNHQIEIIRIFDSAQKPPDKW